MSNSKHVAILVGHFAAANTLALRVDRVSKARGYYTNVKSMWIKTSARGRVWKSKKEFSCVGDPYGL